MNQPDITMDSIKLYNDLMALCASNEAFYYIDHEYGGETFRIFNYRLASYSDFLLPGALECRGHMFHINHSDMNPHGPCLVSLPMEKFFNVGENPFTMDLDWSKVVRVDDKLDGSLISTVQFGNDFILKSKGSLSSDQAKAATAWLNRDENSPFKWMLWNLASQAYTVNLEWTAPDNQIVLGYDDARLRILNIRDMRDGSYLSKAHSGIPSQYWVDMFDEVVDDAWIENARKKVGIEGYVLWFENGLKAKLKTDWYCDLHLQKEQVTNPRRLFESVLMERSDDLKALFVNDPLSVARIESMEAFGKSLYNRLHKLVDEFYQSNKHLDRKDYAIKGQAELKKDGVFSQAMNLYLGKDIGLKEHLVKNFKAFGITDTSTED